MRYTKQGWTHDTKNTMPYMLVRPAKEGDECTYVLAMASADDVSTCCLPRSTSYIGRGDPMTLAECLMLLANISLGQRYTTPQGQSQFIGRYNKTFFRPSTSVKYAFTQDTVSKASSLANYVHASRWNRAFGVMESLYEEYLFICGNIAYSLYDAAYRYAGQDEEMSCAAPKRKNGLYVQDMDEKTCHEVAQYVDSPSKAAEVVEGAMICAFIQDRSAIAKDRANLQLQTTLSKYREVGAPDISKMAEENTLACVELLDYFTKLAHAGNAEFWIVCEEADGVTAFTVYDKARWETRGGIRGFVRIPTRSKTKKATETAGTKRAKGAKISTKSSEKSDKKNDAKSSTKRNAKSGMNGEKQKRSDEEGAGA